MKKKLHTSYIVFCSVIMIFSSYIFTGMVVVADVSETGTQKFQQPLLKMQEEVTPPKQPRSSLKEEDILPTIEDSKTVALPEIEVGKNSTYIEKEVGLENNLVEDKSDRAPENENKLQTKSKKGEWPSAVSFLNAASWSFEGGILTVDSAKAFQLSRKAPWLTGKISRDEIEKIVFTSTVFLPSDSSFLFSSMATLREISGPLNLEQVKNLDYMFYNTPRLTELNISMANKESATATTTAHMFHNAAALTSLDLSSFDTSNVTDMSSMFAGASSLQSLDLSSFDTSNVTDMSYMFHNTESLTSINLGSFDTSKVTDMTSLFEKASSLQSLDLSSFDTSNITDMSNMFRYTQSLTSLVLSNFDTSKVTSFSFMFNEANALTSLDLSSFDTSNVTDMSYMFHNTESLTSINLGSFDTSNVTDMSSMFAGTKSLQSLDLSSFDTSNVKDMNAMFYQIGVQFLNLSNFDTSNVTNMKRMFNSSKALTINLSSFDTSNVTDMQQIFDNAESLISLELGNFNTSNVTDMSFMFHNVKNLTSLDLGSFATSNVTDMRSMFAGTKSLQSLDLSSFDTSNVKDMGAMFYQTGVQFLNLSSFDTSNVKDMSAMFDQVVLNKLVLGPNFRFFSNSKLGAPSNINENAESTGKWIREDGNSKAYCTDDFMENYGQGDLTSGTYVAQLKSLTFKEVPEKISFKDTKISNHTTLTYRKDPEWKMIVEDTRHAFGQWYVTAGMEEDFRDSQGNTANSELLLFRKKEQNDQWIKLNSEILVYESQGETGLDEHIISWGEDEGPLIQATPGSVKADQYKCIIKWSLVDAPL